MKTFNISPKIHFGTGSLSYLSCLKCNKAFVVTDPFMVQSGFISKVTCELEKANIEYEIFSDVVPDPPIEAIVKGMKAMDRCNPDLVITLGGGSAIDSAKSICQFRRLVKKGLHNDETVIKPLFIAIPTTSGTGSEVTNFSVITDRRENVKYPIVDDELTPDEAIIDGSLVKTAPKSITADTGMDVLTHAIEAYVSTEASDYSDALAEKAIKLVFDYLLKAYKNGNDEEARGKMHNASCIAGMAFTNASLGMNHSMAHILGGRFHIPHGKANAILLPYVIEYNADIKNSHLNNYTKAANRYAEISKFLGLSSGNVRDGVKSLVNSIKLLQRNLGIPSKIKDLKISENDFEHEIKNIAIIAIKDGCTHTNPRIPEEKEIEDLFRKVYWGR